MEDATTNNAGSNNQEEKRDTHSVTKNEESMPGNVSARKDAENKGTGPGPDIAAGGGSAEKQPKEHTGKNTEMGGATGGTPGMPDASEGNDNTTRPD